VALFEQRLLDEGLLDADTAQEIHQRTRQEAIDARKKALSDPMPDPSTVEDGVYAD
jgi:TPP-dependent pyruvate/acetoin dehydrogenase alpha subunit